MSQPLSTGAEEYLSWLAVEKGRSRNTLAAYRRDIAVWERWARDAGIDPLDAGPEAIERHLAELRGQGRHPTSMARSTTALRGLFRFLVGEGTIAGDPTADLRSPRLPRRLPKALGESQVSELLDSVSGTGAADLRDRALLELLYGSGARISEVVGLSLADLQGDQTPPPGVRQGGQGAPRPPGWPGPGRSGRAGCHPTVGPSWPPTAGAGAPTPRRCSSTPGAGASAARGPGPSSNTAPSGWGSEPWSAPMCCDIPAPATCWPTGPTSGSSRSSWATSPSPPPRSTPELSHDHLRTSYEQAHPRASLPQLK